MRPHRRQPTRLLHPQDSPGKNIGVGCHFLLRCMKVKSLSRARLLATPWTGAHQAPPSMGFSRQAYWSRVPLPSPSFSIEQLKWKNSNLDLRAGRCGFELWVCQILACPFGPLSLSEPQFLHHEVWEDYAYLINLFRGLNEVRHKACSRTVT